MNKANLAKRSIGAALLLLLFGAACPHTLPPYDYSREPDPRTREFTVGIADQLRIDVWGNQQLSTDASVRPDGTITMPLIGDLKANGKTPSRLREEIKTKLRKFLAQLPAVTVAVTQVNSYRFTVGGQVTRSGAFAPRRYVTVAEAIALAGGITRFASPEKVVIIRQNRSGKVRRIPVDYNQIASGKRPDMNLVLLPGDTLYVP